MAYDAHKNLAVSLVATAPSPATTGTSLVVTAGHGTRFPAAPFNATIWATGETPNPSNAEIVRVTNVSTDTLTITRAQESTTARTVVVGDNISAAITAKTLTDVEGDTLQAANDLSDVADAATARTNLGLGTAATTAASAYATAAQGATADTALQAASNLSDVAAAATARTNLGLGTAAEVDTGTGAGNAILGNDSRLTDDRDPNTHASDHDTGGGDAITSLAASVIDSGTVATARLGSGTADATTILYGDQTYKAAPSGGGGGVVGAFPVKSAGVGSDEWSLPPSIRATGAAATVAISAGTIWYTPILVGADITITGIATRCTTAAASSLVRTGLFAADDEWQPSSLTNEFATFDTSTTGVKSTTGLSVSVPAGRYLIGARTEVGNPTLVYYSNTSSQMDGYTKQLSVGGGMYPTPTATTAVAFSTLPAWAATVTQNYCWTFLRWTVD